jgi:HAE1 family hydrophobic/amphiphilic exporter-1
MPIARFAVSRRVAVTMLACAIVVLGLFALPRLPVSLLPSFSPPAITVTVNYPNVAPEQIETLVTRPIENAVSRVNGIEEINSTSQEGQSIVTATFHYGVNIDTAAVDVQEQVDRARDQLPNDPTLQTPQIVKFDPNLLPVVRLYVTDPNMTLRRLGDLFTNELADEFSSVDGVAAVSVTNDQQRAIMIEPDANLLAGYGLTMNQIVTRVQQENVNLPAGIVRVGPNDYQVRTDALYRSARQIADTVVAVRNGVPVYLRDVAHVADGITEQRSFQRLNGKPALGIVINAQPDANIVSASLGVERKIAEIERRYPGMHMSVVFDQRGFILEAVSALEHTAIYGAILAVLVILLFLHSWRSTLVVAVSLPISVLGSLFAAYVFGYSLNVMTLGGLALAVGLIVDDAIVVIENIARHRARGRSARDAAQNATAEIFSAVLASSITVVTVFVPLVLIPGLQGLLFTPFALMVMVAVALSFVVAITTVPMLSTVLWAKDRPTSNGAENNGGRYARFMRGFDALYERFAAWYERVLRSAVDHPGRVFTGAAVAVAITVFVVKLGMVQTEIFPATNSRYARFFFRMPPGTALAITDAVSRDIEDRMLKDPRVQNVGAQVGTEGFFNPTQVSNQGMLSVTLKPGTTSAQSARFVADWQAALTGYGASPERSAMLRKQYGPPIPGLKLFGHTIDIVQMIIARGQSALDIQIYGPDVKELYHLAHDVALPRLAQIPGISRPDTSITDTQPELDVHVHRSLAATLGLSTQAITQTVDTATAGTIASYLQINGTQYPIVVQLPLSQRHSYASLEDLLVPAATLPNAPYSLPAMPLRELASIGYGTGPSEITRQNKQREIDITADLLGISLGQAVAEATRVMDSIALPPGYHWEFGQSVTQQSQTFSSLALIVLLAIVLIYMLLAAQFESLLHPLVIMAAVPLASTGVVLSLVLSHRAFGLTAFIGVLMLVGIVVKNAILVVEFTNQLRARGVPPREAVLRAAPMRLRPIVMTTLATVGGMLPIALGLEHGSQTQAPLGTVVIGGLLFSTMLSLLVVPTLYLWAARHLEPRLGGFTPPQDGAQVSAEAQEPAPAL